MTDLTADDLARLRSWANRTDPERSMGTHIYDCFCVWCQSDPTENGSHETALQLLDLIDDLALFGMFISGKRPWHGEDEATIARIARAGRFLDRTER